MRRPPNLSRFSRDSGGASAVEYALILGALMLVILAGVTLVGSNLNGLFTRTAAFIGAAPTS